MKHCSLAMSPGTRRHIGLGLIVCPLWINNLLIRQRLWTHHVGERVTCEIQYHVSCFPFRQETDCCHH